MTRSTVRAIALAMALGTVPALLGAQGAPAAPPADRAEVLAVLHRLFEGMRRGDSTMIRSVFLPGATLTTATLRANQQVQSVGSIDPFVASVGVPRAEPLDERLRNEVVLIDGPLATVWADYTLYIGSRMSHCGVDVAVLVRTAAGWRIASLADTRRTTGCD